MIFTKSNLFVEKHEDGWFRLKLMMPQETGNFIHTDSQLQINEAVLIRDLLIDQEFYGKDIKLKEVEKYYRLIINAKDVNGDTIVFHSRLLNLNDAVYERDMLA